MNPIASLLASIAASWKTSLVGLITLGLGIATSFFGVTIPGVALTFYQAVPIAIGLILAKDANVSNSPTPLVVGQALPTQMPTTTTTMVTVPSTTEVSTTK